MRIHFIAIGGSIMHSLAIALHQAGHQVTGSDDQVYDPARTRLAAHGLLPAAEGWDASRITPDIEAVILGMHAFGDNPEAAEAIRLGIPMYSFPEFIYQQARQKQRIVVAGSYGKTTVTSMIMHVLEACGRKFDYLVGATVPGFENAVRLSADAPTIIIEGDEYLASSTDPRPKFLLYQPHAVVVTGISWDHINVFPTEDIYVEQFEKLLRSLEKAAEIIYNEEDPRLTRLVNACTDDAIHYKYPFVTPPYKIRNDRFEVKIAGERFPVSVIGKHNMANMAAAWEVCKLLSIEPEEFRTHIASFVGASLRMETVHESDNLLIIRDYAHAPAKVEATVQAAAEKYKHRNLIACAEMHTFSSLNKAYLRHYQGTLSKARHKIVYINPKALEKRRMPPISAKEVMQAFGDPQLRYATDTETLRRYIREACTGDDVVLMMSSGNFDGLDLKSLG
ncbi:MAG: Mur ligase family protein [Bacteroidia bacterium]|nr:Mur ligase family protein [Bacteroidia bacterium]